MPGRTLLTSEQRLRLFNSDIMRERIGSCKNSSKQQCDSGEPIEGFKQL